MTVAALMGSGIIYALMMSEQFAARSRMLTNARAVVQRNMDAATSVLFTPSLTPVVLALTSGTTCDDDLGSPTENLSVQPGATNVLVSGTLSRTVTQEPIDSSLNAAGVVVRRITFRVDYDFQKRHYTYSESTLRSQDTQ